jgi:hypothetical protein
MVDANVNIYASCIYEDKSFTTNYCSPNGLLVEAGLIAWSPEACLEQLRTDILCKCNFWTKDGEQIQIQGNILHDV